MKQFAATLTAMLVATGASAFDLGDHNTNINKNANLNANANYNSNANYNKNIAAQGQLQAQGQYQSMSGGNVTVNDRLQAPAVGAPGFSSGHPCGIAPASFGLSIVGGALSAGGQRSDDACLLAQMGYKDAAMVMIAKRNAQAKDALTQTGYIAAPANVSSRSVAPETVSIAYTSCEYDGNAIRVGVKRGATEAVKAKAVAQCRSSLK